MDMNTSINLSPCTCQFNHNSDNVTASFSSLPAEIKSLIINNLGPETNRSLLEQDPFEFRDNTDKKALAACCLVNHELNTLASVHLLE